MSVEENPIKFLEVKGRVGLDGKTVCHVQLQPYYFNILNGKWQIALRDVKIITNKFVQPTLLQDRTFFEVSTNLVQGQFNVNSQRQEPGIENLTYQYLLDISLNCIFKCFSLLCGS